MTADPGDEVTVGKAENFAVGIPQSACLKRCGRRNGDPPRDATLLSLNQVDGFRLSRLCVARSQPRPKGVHAEFCENGAKAPGGKPLGIEYGAIFLPSIQWPSCAKKTIILRTSRRLTEPMHSGTGCGSLTCRSRGTRRSASLPSVYVPLPNPNRAAFLYQRSRQQRGSVSSINYWLGAWDQQPPGLFEHVPTSPVVRLSSRRSAWEKEWSVVMTSPSTQS